MMFFSPDLLDGFTLIGLITMMSIVVCPLVMWSLTVNLHDEATV